MADSEHITAAPACPDAELIAACEAFMELNARIEAVGSCGSDRDDWVTKMLAELDALMEVTCRLRATTPAGLEARVRMLVAWEPNAISDNPEATWDVRMAAALVRNMAPRRSGGQQRGHRAEIGIVAPG